MLLVQLLLQLRPRQRGRRGRLLLVALLLAGGICRQHGIQLSHVEREQSAAMTALPR